MKAGDNISHFSVVSTRYSCLNYSNVLSFLKKLSMHFLVYLKDSLSIAFLMELKDVTLSFNYSPIKHSRSVIAL